MKPWIGWLLLALVATHPAAADQELVTIQLSHRLADEMAALIKPLLDESETVIPNRSMLIVKASPSKIEQILALVKDLDKSRHRLMITVAQGSGLSAEVLNARAGIQATIDPRYADNIRFSARGHVYQTESRGLGDQTQRVQTLDGQTATIVFGEQIPLPTQTITGYGYGVIVNPGIEYVEASTGFAVTPRLTGDQVVIDVAPWSNRMSRDGGGLIDTQGARTTVEATLGEWVEIGGQVETRSQQDGGLLAHRYSTRTEANRIFIKVEDLDREPP